LDYTIKAIKLLVIPIPLPNYYTMLDEIILIDDDKMTTLLNKKLVEQVLPDGLISSFENGEKGLSYMLSVLDKARKTLVIVDIEMPVMDGFEFLSIYENAIAYQDHSFTVCLLTGSQDEQDFEKSKKFPSVLGYATKPLTKEKIKTLIEQATTHLG